MKTDLESDQNEETAPSSEADHPKRSGGFLRGLVSFLLCVGLLVFSISIFGFLFKHRPTVIESETKRLLPLVETIALSPESVTEVYLGYGSARADLDVSVSVEVSGLVVDIPDPIKDGARVKRGDVLVKLDERDYQRQRDKFLSQVADAVAQLGRLDIEEENAGRLIAIAENEKNVAAEEYQRLSGLFEKNLASKKEFDDSRLSLDRARRLLQGLQNERALIPARRAELGAVRDARQADADMATIDVERCTIKAPMDGQIDTVSVEVGDHAAAGTSVARLVGTRLIEVPIELPLSARPGTKPGAVARLEMDSMPGVEWAAEVRRLSPVADGSSRTFTAYLEVDNEKQAVSLVPGYFLTARLDGPVRSSALLVPRGAIVNDRILVVVDGVAEERKIQVDCRIDDRAVISGNVSAGDFVIVTNLDEIHDGFGVRTGGERETTEASPEESNP